MPDCARTLNDYLKVAKEGALLRILKGKVSAVLGGDCHDYAILEMEQVFQHSADYLTKNFKGCRYFHFPAGFEKAHKEQSDGSDGPIWCHLLFFYWEELIQRLQTVL